MTEPHPMYNFTQAELARFPNLGEAVEKTASEVEGALFWVVGESGITEMPRNIMNIVDRTIDGTDAQKEAVMIGVLHSIAPEELAQGKGSFAATYGNDAGALLEQLAGFDKNSKDVLPEQIAQVTAVLNVAVLQAQREILAGGPQDEQPPAEIVDAVKQGMVETDRIMLPNLNAPRLEALYKQESRITLDMLEGKPAPAAQPKPRKHGGLTL